MSELRVEPTAIPGLLIIDLVVNGDNRGWFKENWQRQKMIDLGLPDFGPVQNNVSFNATRGVTRGFHAEPWDKFISVATGRIFGAWVDLREGPTFGTVVTVEHGPERAVFVPGGVGNAFQVLEPGTAYSYLVNDHWSPEARESYTFVNLGDPTLAVGWPIPLDQCELSEADKAHPVLGDVRPFPAKRTLIVGAGGQVGRALQRLLPDALALTRAECDLADPEALEKIDWRSVDTVINAAAYTAVDAAETEDGRRQAWQVNVHAVGRLVDKARQHRLRLVHISSDYVFDGSRELHDEAESFAPLGVYGQTKAAGDALVETWPRHYLIRTSWVVGDGKNFVQTMASLADRGIAPSVIDDQHGRLTFAADIAAAIVQLLTAAAPYGSYNVSCDGPVRTWADLAAAVFVARGRPADDVTRVTTEEYGEGKALAPRPRHSALDLTKAKAAGLTLPDGDQALGDYLATLECAPNR
jgi:dTDP-4-dehydrorhamnose reductase/dTDP-4-dehydrorhamnose 3,5-epimerase